MAQATEAHHWKYVPDKEMTADHLIAVDDVCRSLYAKLKVHPQVDQLKMGLEWLKKNCPSLVNRRTEETAPH